ncbi:hypothetical protein JWS13_05175 (plasmid) [Rhodococcus pseudokoreensis]|uniref:Uncharacterized protein n=1 Tax=Rhodococcus pseudokoreensis TaxID=2811421 RepID=A0A974VYQ2_9NOCA|nr:hypothetical protein [Rhodococcus pseudokoreensis]QSE88050.1 hypothetical protein JWS13_05175 [Rhodococcus pseudokoreensis]
MGGAVEAEAAVDPRADRIEQLRRRMDAIPARSAGPPRIGRSDPRPVGEQPAAADIRTLPVAGPLAELLVHRGLVRGTVAQITGPASLHASLLAAVTGSGHWAAVVGDPTLGLLAAVEMGADLNRCAIIRDPGDDPIAIAAVLVDGLDLVLVSLGDRDISPSRVRAVTARVRRAGAVLAVDGRWPNVDVRLRAEVAGYHGLAAGRGRVTGLDLDVEAITRGHRPRRARVTVAGCGGHVEWTTATRNPVAPSPAPELRVAQ